MRRAAALFSEMTLSLAWPFTPRLLARHASFERLRLYVFLYNLVVMTVSLALTRELLEEMRLGNDLTAFGLSARWAEGLFRYIAWTAANFPIVAAFRRRFDADLELANADKLAPALFFGRQIFWASLIASLAHDVVINARAYGVHAVGNAASSPLTAWALGDIGFSSGREFLAQARDVLHVAAVSLFRAGAVTYALFAGSKVGAAVARVVVAYCVGGFFLFYLHQAGLVRAPAGAERAVARLESNLKRDEKTISNYLDLARDLVSPAQEGFFQPAMLVSSRAASEAHAAGDPKSRDAWLAVGRMAQRGYHAIEGVNNGARLYAARVRAYRDQRFRSVGPVLHFSFMMVYFIPYYSVAVGGAWWLMRRARRKYRPLE